jgi:hypothetical protein
MLNSQALVGNPRSAHAQLSGFWAIIVVRMLSSQALVVNPHSAHAQLSGLHSQSSDVIFMAAYAQSQFLGSRDQCSDF